MCSRWGYDCGRNSLNCMFWRVNLFVIKGKFDNDEGGYG